MIMVPQRPDEDKRRNGSDFADEVWVAYQEAKANAETDIEYFVADALEDLYSCCLHSAATDMEDVMAWRDQRRRDANQSYINLGKAAAFDAAREAARAK